MQNARSLASCIDRLESWLEHRKGGGGPELTEGAAPPNAIEAEEEEGRLLERVGTEYTKLQYFLRKCDQQEKLLRHVRPVSRLLTLFPCPPPLHPNLSLPPQRMLKVAERLHSRLDAYFLAALPTPAEVSEAAAGDRSGESPAWATPTRGHRLRTALRVFISTDRAGEAMLLLRRHLVEPLLDKVRPRSPPFPKRPLIGCFSLTRRSTWTRGCPMKAWPSFTTPSCSSCLPR